MQSEERPAPVPSEPTILSQTSSPPILEGRLHPLTMVFSVWKAVRRILIPAIPLVIFGSRLALPSFLLFVLGVAVIRALVRYLSFSYRIEESDIVVRQGILKRTERHIPLDRVQEVRIEQGVLHRLFEVVDVHVETAGGKGPEASLSVLSRLEAARLRESVFARGTGRRARVAAAGGAESAVLKELSVGELALAGLTSNHLVSALVIVGAIWAFLDDVLPEHFYERIAVGVYDYAHRLLERGAQTAVAITVAATLAVLLLSTVFSVLASIVLFYGFSLTRTGEDLQRVYGLITKRSSSLPRRRIQVLEIEEGFLRRLFRLATLRADSAGSRNRESNERRGGRDVLMPVIRRSEVERLLPAFFPDIPAGPIGWHRVSKLAIARGAAKGAVLCAAVSTALSIYNQNAAGMWLLTLLPLVYLINAVRYNNLGYALAEHYFHTRRGWLSRSTHIVPIRNAQAIVVTQGPFDRWLGLASLTVDSAGQAHTGGGPRISNLPLETAQSLARILASRAAATRFRWR